MFGYVLPAVPELMVKDYKLFRAYYCGLCKSIGKNIGLLPRFSLNYDMVFLAMFIDSLLAEPAKTVKNICILCPLGRRQAVCDNPALRYAASCNLVLAYHKLKDDLADSHEIKAWLGLTVLKPYLNTLPDDHSDMHELVVERLQELSAMEGDNQRLSIDELSHPFSDLVGLLLSDYFRDQSYRTSVYWFGYNLGKWIYIIDAFDDLQRDITSNEFNPLHSSFGPIDSAYSDFVNKIAPRVEFVLISCANTCLSLYEGLPINKNGSLIRNVLQLGLMGRISHVMEKGGVAVD